MKKIFIVAGLLTSFLFALTSNAQDNPLKIGYTNLDYILSLLPEAKQVESELQSYEKQLQNQMQTKYAEYEKKLQDYQKAAQSGLMTDVVREDKEKELYRMQNSIKEFEENAQSSLQKKQVTLLEPILERIQKAIDQVAEENGYHYILSTHADYGGSAIILFAKNKDDNISDLVLKRLGVTPPQSKGEETKPGGAQGSGTAPANNNNTNTNPAPGSGAPVKNKN